jgi:hypothetical protein
MLSFRTVSATRSRCLSCMENAFWATTTRMRSSRRKKFKFAGMRLPYDHKHRHGSDKGVPYAFQDAYQLLSDFFKEVDQVLQEMKRS